MRMHDTIFRSLFIRPRTALLTGALLAAGTLLAAPAQETGPRAWWRFDAAGGKTVRDSASGIDDHIHGRFKTAPGVDGSSLQFDGFTTRIVRPGRRAPRLSGSLTVEAWVAAAAYPWNWCPVISQREEERLGYFFGVDARGIVGLHMAIDGQWAECLSESRIPLGRWTHIAGAYDAETGRMTVYIDGKPAGSRTANGRIFFAPGAELRIGMNPDRVPPFYGRSRANRPSWFSFDGRMDEIKLFDRSLSGAEIEAEAAREPAPPDFPSRVLPAGPDGPAPFGARYTRLRYYEEWDALWQVGPHSDVVVRFDDSPVRVVFWRGTRYSPVWVTENNIWSADQSFETGTGDVGCVEHMQDIHCRYSHVRIIENTPARAVVHWRYAPVGSYDFLWIRDETTGRALWVDEYYTFYPDGVGVRKMTWKRFREDENVPPWIQKQETIVLCHPGQVPEEVIHTDFLTLADFDGASRTYAWEPELRRNRDILPKDAPIQVVNLKSRYKPFIIFEPGSRRGYIGGNPGLFSAFSTCNHWPVAQISSDGRDALGPDRASSFLGTTTAPIFREASDGTVWAGWLYGMTEGPAADLAPLGRSWASAPALEGTGSGYRNRGFDPGQRAYVLECAQTGRPEILEGEFRASPDSPLINAAVYIEGWGNSGVRARLDGRALAKEDGFEYGFIPTGEGMDLVIWIECESTRPVKLTLSPEETAR